MKYLAHIIIAVCCASIFFSCETTTTEKQTSNIAQLTAFSFAHNDSMPGLSKALFTIEERLDTGLVWNKDSMLYGTRLDSVVPRFVFAATPGISYLTLPDTTCSLTGYDTLNFSKGPIYLTILSSDESTTKVYEIKPTVHQVDPDLYQWSSLTHSIYPADDSEQKVVELGSSFVMISNNGFQLHAYTSQDGALWQSEGQIAGLPASANIRQIVSDGTTLYYGEGNQLYTSTNATQWSAQTVTYPIHTLLLYWNEVVWALVENDGYELATYDGSIHLSGLRPSSDFPVSDFATVCFHSASQRERAMIIGGFAQSGKALNTRWNLEYTPYASQNKGYRMEEFSIDRPSFTSLTGISVIWYNNQLMMFGGVDANRNYFGRHILISNDEGLNWIPADSTKNQLPTEYGERQKQNAIVRDNNIYLFGGQDKNTTFSDVYRGRLNSIDWNK